MANILDYIDWRGDLTISADSLNEVDGLIFSALSYLNFSGIAERSEGIALREAASVFFEEKRDSLENTGDLQKPALYELLRKMAESKRYGKLKLCNYVQKLDRESNEQFAAVTLRLPANRIFIAYRGTDDTLLGWKEDLLMTAMDTIPSQQEALNYLKQIASENVVERIYLGGHSKGGNIAVYSAVHCGEEIQNRIVGVFNYDGPGFRKSIWETAEYINIKDRIDTYVPQMSVVGMLMEHDKDYAVIRSSKKGAMQHDGFSWEVLGAQFVRVEKVAKRSHIVDRTFRGVLEKFDEEQRVQVTNLLFDLLESNDNRTLTDIKQEALKSIVAMIRNYDHFNSEERKMLKQTVSNALQEWIHNYRTIG